MATLVMAPNTGILFGTIPNTINFFTPEMSFLIQNACVQDRNILITQIFRPMHGLTKRRNYWRA